jgi:hypothetical protein
LYDLTFTFLDSIKHKRFWAERQKALPEFDHFFISSWVKYWFLTVVPKYLSCAKFSRICLLYLCHYFALRSGDNTPTCTWLFCISFSLDNWKGHFTYKSKQYSTCISWGFSDRFWIPLLFAKAFMCVRNLG